MNNFDKVHTSSLREQVVQQIRASIIAGRLQPGDHIVETSLTEQLGVSRTPIREALILLEREGLVISEPNRGSYVRAYDAQDVDAIFEMRATLENAAGEACIRALGDVDYTHLDKLIETQKEHIERGNREEVRAVDMAFHRYLIEKSHNPILERFWSEIVAQVAALLHVRASAFPNYNEYLAVSDHSSIVFAYRQRDLNELRQVNLRINERVAAECRAAIHEQGG